MSWTITQTGVRVAWSGLRGSVFSGPRKSELEEANRQSNARLMECQEEIRRKRNMLEEADKARQHLVQEHIKVSEANSNLSQDNCDLESKFLKAREEADAGRGKLEELQKEVEAEQAEVDRLQEELNVLRQKRAMVDRACEDLPLSPERKVAGNLERGSKQEEGQEDRVDSRGSGLKKDAAMVSSLPLVGMAAEAAELSKREYRSLELQVTDIAAKTVVVDREREDLEKQVRAWLEELEQLRKDHAALQDSHAGAVDSKKFVDNEVERLQKAHDSFQEKLNAATKELETTEATYARTNALLGQNRQETEALRDMAWEELWGAESKLSKTSRIREYATHEAERHQRDLVKLTMAHSQKIAASDGYSDCGLGGMRGLPDPDSPEVKSSLAKASLHAAHAQTPRGLNGRPLSARGLRSELVGAGQQVVGAPL